MAYRSLDLSRLSLIFFANACLATSGCAFKIVDLTGREPPSTASIELPFSDVVAIEKLEADSDYADAAPFQQSLPKALRTHQVFRKVVASDEAADVILRGQVRGEFSGGGMNFLTWFPGPFVLMHNWRGTRFTYAANAYVELVDASTDEVIGQYRANAMRELIHPSSNPGPMFGAAIVIPGVVKGAMNVSPRSKYRTMLYAAVYGDLWEEITAQIAVSRNDYYVQREEERRRACGDLYDSPPRSGLNWTDYRACQTQKFQRVSKRTTSAGVATVYRSEYDLREIDVIDGRIEGWTEPTDLPHVGAGK